VNHLVLLRRISASVQHDRLGASWVLAEEANLSAEYTVICKGQLTW
jgi:hypothetical protein